jgi:hypothetical protein
MRQILARADEVIESNDWESWFDVVTESASESGRDVRNWHEETIDARRQPRQFEATSAPRVAS